MPLQNRVDPFGEISAVAARGTMMGNRGGCFHTGARMLLPRRCWVSRRWIVCVLEFRGRHRRVMAPGRYTELFFLDEATALAAGHRPCFECRRADHERFKQAWLRGNPFQRFANDVSIDVIDRVLHAERLGPDRAKQTYRAWLGELPDGVFVTTDSYPQTPCLIVGGALWPWGFGGYTEPRPLRRGAGVTVLTPRSTVAAIAAGYAPLLHPSVAARL
jgi:hypothetical protein